VKRKIVFFHLLNDFSGSPHILALIVKGLLARGYSVEVFTSLNRKGFLSDMDGVRYHNIYYNFSNNRIKTSLLLVYAQLASFFTVVKYCFESNVTVYINTIYPFGAAIGAALTRKRLIYHVHENPIIKSIISSFAMFVLNNLANKAIYVSMYLYNNSTLKESKKELVYNALSSEFVMTSEQAVYKKKSTNILMICSLRTFKGVFIFVEIAAVLDQYSFTLVVNGTNDEIVSFFKGITIPGNLEIFSSKQNVHPFYQKAHLVLNLSIPDLWIETFGLTILEAMTYGIPVIVPPVGGISELIDDGIEGFKVDARDKELLISKIREVFSDDMKYQTLSKNAKKKSMSFSSTRLIDSVEKIICDRN
jgi:L-malate glycosyltransferase